MSSENAIIINGEEFSFTSGETILEVAQRNGVDIPTLCHLKGASPTGACRICLVEVERARTLVAACAAPAAPQMVVKTSSPRIIKARRMSIELLMTSGLHDCLVEEPKADSADSQLRVIEGEGQKTLCPVDGDCTLQDLAREYRVETNRFEPTKCPYPVEDVNPFIVRDFSRCILCGRCVQACNEVQVNDAINFGYRGSAAKIVTRGDRALKDSDCVFCGECVQACPVGALYAKRRPQVELAADGSPVEADKVRTTCSYCGVGCQLHLHVRQGRVVEISGIEDAAPNFGSLCVKGRYAFDFIHHENRLKTPLIRENGSFKEASWEEALGLVAERLTQIRDESGPDSIQVLSSARITNEENYLAQKFARAVVGTNNVDHCARLCHASTVTGLAAAFGSGAMTNPIADIEEAEVILVTGSNTTESHPVLSSFAKRAVAFNGAKLILVDPRQIPISRHADLWIRQRVGTDVAWINGMIHVIIQEKLYDEGYIASRTEGFDELVKASEPYTPEYVEEVTGIPRQQIVDAARLYASGKPASILYAMGITQHTTGTDNVKSLANLAMLCGNVGVRGGGVNPLRGQNNVQGACDMGALPNVFTGYQKVDDDAARGRMEEAWNTSLSGKPGLAVTDMMNLAYEGKMKAAYIIGENVMVSDPDLNHVEKSLEKLDFLVVQDIFLTETAEMADVVLPAASFAEKEGTFVNTERKVLRVRKGVEPPGEAKADWRIVCELAKRMGFPMEYESSQAIMEEIATVTPSFGGIRYDRLEEDGLHWPCPDVDHPGTPRLHAEQFTRGLGKFHAVEYLPADELPDDEFPLFLTTGRVLYHYHTGTMTMKTPGLNEIVPECFVEVSREDARACQVEHDSLIRIASRRGEIEARAKVSDKVDKGTIFIPFHFADAAANRLTNGALDPTARIPEYKVCAVRIENV